ncbi:hypothetical protein FIBSPDRAFT_917512 [Athelia psychrophila]|uniref:FAM86 N-terminal domain-containing protein n=1 Tax=Athelia psychrophila TaxID=1759441 RepID=A0A166RZI4_9AGAM|nr:hypothetical protein FIBSPDRAFT_917512 [Fibularhizoctonia sp. CBS 109695]
MLLPRVLFDILRGYSSLVPPKLLLFPKELPFTEIRDFLVKALLLAKDVPHLQAYPPSDQYQFSFWKWAIHNLEEMAATEDDVEIDDRIYEHFMTLFNAPSMYELCVYLRSRPPSQSHTTQYWTGTPHPLPNVDLSEWHTLTLLESRTTVEHGTTAMRTWLAARILAQFLVEHPRYVCGKRMLELGAGTGFLGAVVASVQLQLATEGKEEEGRKREEIGTLWLTDVNDAALERCKYNLQISCNPSSSHPEVHYRPLDWSDALDALTSSANSTNAPLRSMLMEEVRADVIIGADLVFDPSLIPALVGTLCIALERGTAEALIALTVRNEATLRAFLDAAEKDLVVRDLAVHFPPSERMFVDASSAVDDAMDVKIYLLRKRPADKNGTSG